MGRKLRKNSQVKVSFHYASSNEEESTIITYNKPKNVNSIMKCLMEEVSESLDKLRIEKNISYESKTCCLKLQNINNAEITKQLKVDIDDKVELKKTIKTVLGTFNKADQELCISIDDFSSSFGQEVLVSSTNDLSNTSTICRDDPSSLDKLKKRSKTYDEDGKTVGIDTKDVFNSEDTGEHYVGLVNQAMTCYLNSLLQALYMTPEFRNALYNWEYKYLEGDEPTLSIPFQLQKLFLNLQISQKSAVETKSLTESFGWDSSEAWEQRDIQEFCRLMFDDLERNFKDSKQADLINRLYEGKISDCIKCLNCNTVKSRENTFLTIPLPVRSFDVNETYGSVEEALEAFVKCETLDESNQYFCQICFKKTNAQKELKFTKFPYILMLQLNRFDFDQNKNCRMKLNDKVTFPEVLNLDSFIQSASNPKSPSLEEDGGLYVKSDDSFITDSSIVDEEYTPHNALDSKSINLSNPDQLNDEGIVMSNDTSSCSSLNQNHEKLRKNYSYELFSIMIHSGTARSGHYYAYIKDFRTGKWLCFNDKKVTSINSKDIQKIYGEGNKARYYRSLNSTNAYMLMYRQIDLEHNCLPIKAEDFPVHIKDLVEKMKNDDFIVHSSQRGSKKPIDCEDIAIDLKESVNVNISRKLSFEDIDTDPCEESGSKEATKFNKNVKDVKDKKKMKEAKKVEEVGAASLEKTNSNLAPIKTETNLETKTSVQSKKKSQLKSIDTKKSIKVCHSGSSIVGSWLPKSSTRTTRMQISSHNPKPLRRKVYNLRQQIRDYYSFDSDDSPQPVKSVSNLPTSN